MQLGERRAATVTVGVAAGQRLGRLRSPYVLRGRGTPPGRGVDTTYLLVLRTGTTQIHIHSFILTDTIDLRFCCQPDSAHITSCDTEVPRLDTASTLLDGSPSAELDFLIEIYRSHDENNIR